MRGDDALSEELTNYPSANYGYAYVGQQRVAGKLGASLRTVQRMFARYIAAGFLVREFGGQGRTSKWTFAIGGVPCFESNNSASLAGLGPPHMAALDMTRMAALDPPQVAYKPYELQPVERHLPEQSAFSPSPPPSSEPRAKGTGEIAAEILAAVPSNLRKLPIWRGLASWIDATIADECILPVDVVLGVTGAMPPANGIAPSTLRYFDKAVRRASAARNCPLPPAGATPVTLAAFCRYVEQTRGELAGSLAVRLTPQFLERMHRDFAARTIGMDGALSEIARELGHARG